MQLRKQEPGLCNIPNIFAELNDIFLRASQTNSVYDTHDSLIKQEVIFFLQEKINSWASILKCSKSDFCYAFTLPTKWSYQIQEQLIRPLFISAGLISKYNHRDRLLFFTQLESIFRYIQSGNNYLSRHIEIEHGRQYAICSLDFVEEKIYVNLDFSSAQYPSLTSIDSKYVPQSLKSINFVFPFELKVKARIQAIIEKRCNTLLLTNSDKLIDMLTNEANIKGLPQWIRLKYDPESKLKISNEVNKSLTYILTIKIKTRY